MPHAHHTGRGAEAQIPSHIAAFMGGDSEAIGGDGLRLRVCKEAARASDDGVGCPVLDDWIDDGHAGSALRTWYGENLVPDRRWLLLALDRDIASIDEMLSLQVNAILHHPLFQALEARWRSLDYLADAAALSTLSVVRVLSASWADVVKDLDRAGDYDRSAVFSKIYSEEIGMLGGQPFGLIIGDYVVQHQPAPDHPTDDVAAINSLAMIGAAAFAPIILGASPRLFQLDSFSELGRPLDVRGIFRQLEYRRWQSMREVEESRFVGVVLPRVVMRRPYGFDAARRDGFRFTESTARPAAADYLWANGAFAFGAVVLRAFANFQWFADIRGAARDDIRGGMVVNLPTLSFTTDSPGIAAKPAMEALLSDLQEKELSELGFITLRKIPFTDNAVFYSNQSLHSPSRALTPTGQVNARLSAMLQYMLCVSRFAHYVKIMGRRFIGSLKTAEEIQEAIQSWLLRYSLGSDEATLEAKSRYPLREASVEIKELPGSAGSYSCILFLRPHFQLDDIATGFRLVTQLSPAQAAA